MRWEVPRLNGDYVTHHNYILLKENLLQHESFCPMKTHSLKRHHGHSRRRHQASSRRGSAHGAKHSTSFQAEKEFCFLLMTLWGRWEQGWWNKMPLLKGWSGASRSPQLTLTSANKPLAVIPVSFSLDGFLWFFTKLERRKYIFYHLAPAWNFTLLEGCYSWDFRSSTANL